MTNAELAALAREAMTLFRDPQARILANLMVRTRYALASPRNADELALNTMDVLRDVSAAHGSELEVLQRRVRSGDLPWE